MKQTKNNHERRGVATSDHPIASSDDGRKFAGVASVFDSPSEDMGGWYEVIDKRAFDDVLETDPDVVCVWNHREEDLLGRTRSGTLRLWTEDDGLHYEVDPPDTQLGRDLRVLLSRGDVSGSSFAFTVPKDGQKWEKRDGQRVRVITKIDGLYDVSLVTNGSYSEASVALRSLKSIEEEEKAAEEPVEEQPEPSGEYVRSVANAKAALAHAGVSLSRNKQ